MRPKARQESTGKISTQESSFSSTVFHTLIENSANAISLVNKRGLVVYSSPSTKKILGYDPQEILGVPGRKFVHPHDLRIILPKLSAIALKEGASKTVEARVKRKDNSYMWAEITVTNMLGNKNVRAVILSYQDITKHKAKEVEAAHSTAIIESSDDAIISKTLDGVIMSWNPAAQKLFGYTAKEAIGRHISSVIIPSALLKEEEEILTRLGRGEKIDHFETIRMDKNQTPLEVSLSISPIIDKEGTIVGAANIIRNIQEAKKREREKYFLVKAQEILSSSIDYETTLKNIATLIVPSVADHTRIIILDEKQRIQEIAVSHRDTEMTRELRDLYNIYSHMFHTPGVARIIKTGKAELINDVSKADVVSKNPKLRKIINRLQIVSYMGVPIRSATRILGVITFSSTTPTHRYTQAELEVALELGLRAGYAVENALLYRNATRAVMLRDEFLTVASHELKTPVTSLKAFGQVLQQRARKQGDMSSVMLFKKMDQQIDRLTHLIYDLLDVTKINSGKLQFHQASYSFDRLVTEILQEVGRTTNSHTFIRSGATNAILKGDRERIGQALTNLLTNAIKYSPNEAKIIITSSSTRKDVTCCVQDFGLGIDSKKLPHIFKRFYRETNNSSHTYPGLGLGLYITSEIIKRQHGRIWVESVKGKGSKFCFTLPRMTDISSMGGISKSQRRNKHEKSAIN